MRNGEYMIYHSIQDLLNLAKEYQIPLWEVVCRADMEERQVTKEQSFETMHRMYEAMKQADSAYDKDLKSASGLAGGDGEKLHCYNAAGKNIAGEYIGLVMEKAVKMGESNACMKRIVAAPTARCMRRDSGSFSGISGIFPGRGTKNGRSNVSDGGNRCGDCGKCKHCGRLRRLPGRNRFGKRHGGGRACLFAGRRR